MSALQAWPLTGMPEIEAGDDLAALIHRQAGSSPGLRDGDIVVVTSKVVSKAEGRVIAVSRSDAIDSETVRVVARRGATTIARTHHGLTLAAAGVDASNVAPGQVVLLPVDPDRSARHLRAALSRGSGRRLAVVVTDTAGRPWRGGQTDIAIGVAGLTPLVDLAGSRDRYGNVLEVTAPAVADEIASVGDLVMGKHEGRPGCVLRGLARLVDDDDGPGAAALLRPVADDMFGLGSREAVLAAVARSDDSAVQSLRRESVPVAELVALAAASDVLAVEERDGRATVSGPHDLATAGALERVVISATTTQWRLEADDRNLGLCRIVLRAGP